MAVRGIKDYFESGELEAIKMKPITTPATGEGTIYYDDEKNCHSTLSDITDVTFNIPLEQCTRVINKTGATITNGTPLGLDAPAATTGLPTLRVAIANTYENAKVHAIATHDIVNGAEAWVTTSGDIGDVNLVGVAELGQTLVTGQTLYLSAIDVGKMTHTPPNIVTKLGAFMTGESGVTQGTLSVFILSNMALPTVLGVVAGNTTVLSLTGTPQVIGGFDSTDGIGVDTDILSGGLTTTQKGFYALNFIASTTFSGVSSTRKIWLHVTPSASPSFTIPVPLARDIDESPLQVNFSFILDAVEEVHMEISADDNFDLTFTDASFSISASHILV